MTKKNLIFCVTVIFIIAYCLLLIVDNHLVEARPANSIFFEDVNLEQVIRREICKAKGEIDAESVRNLTKLDLSAYDIKSVNGMEYLLNLQDLKIDTRLIRDLSPLKKLKNLEILSIGNYKNHNELAIDIKIFEMINLQELNIIRINLNNMDLSRFSQLVKLKKLSLYHTSIDDISFLSNLRKLEILEIRGSFDSWNYIKDIDSISNLINLETVDLMSNNNKTH